jgi:acyl-CoA oxidase
MNSEQGAVEKGAAEKGAGERVDVSAIRDALDGRWASVRRRARTELAEAGLPAATTDTERQRGAVTERLHTLARTEMSRTGFPVEFGGRGDVGASVTAFEMLGHGDLSLMVKAGVQWGLFGGAVELLGTQRHHERYLREIIDLRLPGCFAMTETGHGSDVQKLRTTATFDPGTREFVVHTPHEAARKDYIGNAARDGRMAVVFAQLHTGGRCYGVHAFLVPIRDADGKPLPGLTIGDCGRKGGLNGVDNGRLTFDHVRVPRVALLNRFGDVDENGDYHSDIESDGRRFFTMIGTLIRGRISVAGAAGSAAKTALTIAVRYADVRRQFDRPGSGDEVPLLNFLAHQRKLLPLLARSYAFHFAQGDLVGALHDGTKDERAQREMETRAAGIKALATWHTTATIQTCREACGGAGYLEENRLTELKADTDVFTTFEGDNTVLLQLVAKGLLTDYRDHFGDLGTLGTAKFITEVFVSSVVERTAARSLIERLIAAAPGNQDEANLSDRGWQLKMFTDREEHVLEGLARRLRRATEDDADPFEVFNDAQDHVLRAGRVHVERVVLDSFVDAIDKCTDPATAELLGKVCDLFAVSTIDNDLAWFLGHERISNTRGKAVTAKVNELCKELRPHAATLVDAFGIPDECVAAPIATGVEHRRQDEMRRHDAGR